MQIEVWADVVCPWCGLGSHRLHRALAEFEHRDEVEIVHRAFQLDPGAPEGRSRSTMEALVEKGYPAEQIAPMTERIEQLAQAEGLSPYNVASARTGSTALVQELLAFATDVGLGEEGWAAAYARHWGRNEDVFTLDGVLELAEEIGLDVDEAEAVLTDRRYRDRVRIEQDESRQLGATGVPFVVIDRAYGIAGAQPAEQILDVLHAAWSETHHGKAER